MTNRGDPRSRSVCVVRFSDGRVKPNWGTRATSLGLTRLVEQAPDVRLKSVVDGKLMFDGFEGLQEDGRLNQLGVRLLDHTQVDRGRKLAQALRVHDLHVSYRQTESIAADLLGAPSPPAELRELIEAISAADELWMNGEGDFILRPRKCLLRSIVIMRMALGLGKTVRFVNGMLSPPPEDSSDPTVVEAVGDVLAECASVCYRDPESLRLHQQLYPTVSATWAPDALFLWAPEGAYVQAADMQQLAYGPWSEGLPPAVQDLLLEGRPFVALSGSSAIRSRDRGTEVASGHLASLISDLRKAELEPVVVATCSGDDWMVSVAKGARALAVEARASLSAGLLLMSRAACFASGRYHPSILASLTGTPLVLMESNSHKTRSLQEVLGDPSPSELPFYSNRSGNEALLAAIVRTAGNAPAIREQLLEDSRALAQKLEDSVPTWSRATVAS